MNNYMIEDFHQKLIGLINNSGLTVGTAYFILKDVLNSLEKLYIQSIQEDKENADKYFHMAISAGSNPTELKNAINYYKTGLEETE